jgi:hypothetical protein
MAAVVFDYAEWAAQYDALAAFTNEAAANLYFSIATTLCDNGDCSLVPYDPTATPPVLARQQALYLLVAHMAELGGPNRGGLTGRISSATQGSVTVATELKAQDKAWWYTQTSYGGLYWQMTGIWRSGFYMSGNQPFAQPRPYRV